MSRTITLYGIRYSPWTERARWALDHHRLPYRYYEYVPLLGEPVLRWLARGSGKAKASVPLCRDGARVIGDSLEIMRYADALGERGSLFEGAPDVSGWHGRAEASVERARVRVTHRTLNDPKALEEAAAGAMPACLAPYLKPVAVIGARFLAAKYGFDTARPPEGEHEALSAALETLRAQLRGRPYLGDAFSASDILASGLVHIIRPCDARYIPLGPATRRAWTLEPLERRFADLVEWRDALYAKHR